jgi:hypothetical protein
MLIVELLILLLVSVIATVVLWDFFHPVIFGDEALESWTCEVCGFTAIAPTIELVLDGMRQHDLLFDCGGKYLDDDYDDDV